MGKVRRRHHRAVGRHDPRLLQQLVVPLAAGVELDDHLVTVARRLDFRRIIPPEGHLQRFAQRIVGNAETRSLFRIDPDIGLDRVVLRIRRHVGEMLPVLAHRILQLARPFIRIVHLQCLDDELILAGRAAPAETQALLRRDESSYTGDLARRLPQFLQRLLQWRSCVAVFQLDKDRAVIEWASAVAADRGGHMVDRRVGADRSHDLSLQITHRRIGNVLARTRRNRKPADILGREETARQRLEQIDRATDRSQEDQHDHRPVAQTPAN
ncbi:hypothetical protein D3C80_1259180 [compost metagenome]